MLGEVRARSVLAVRRRRAVESVHDDARRGQVLEALALGLHEQREGRADAAERGELLALPAPSYGRQVADASSAARFRVASESSAMDSTGTHPVGSTR